MDGLVKYLLTNRQDAGLIGYLLVTIVAFVLALYKEWLVLGKTAKRDRDACISKDIALDTVAEKLVDQRILNERATVTIDMLKERARELELDLARREGNPWPSSQPRKPERPR